ncbi:MAG: alpha/beta hydrolase domain-containing protein [Pseudomonadota bacterium]|nr:alpha/beta hydrolase domain-containing protein [Pseudomonadota bacterium]
MTVTDIDILKRDLYCNGERFGNGPAYERIDGIVKYAVDPKDPANARITDLGNAKRDSDGLVRFSGDFTILTPLEGGNGAALLDVPNRGGRVAPRMFNFAPLQEDPHLIEAGDGHLLRHGWTVAFCGWQWDVPRESGRMGLTPPLVAEPDGGRMQLRFQVGWDQGELLLTDQHVGVGPNHATIPPATLNDPKAELLVRDMPYGTAALIPRERWTLEEDRVRFADGFKAGRIYDLLYVPRECPVVGAGLMAMRDFAVFLKQSSSPVSPVEHVIGEGVSQCGRFLRTFLYNGLNLDEEGRLAFDGLLVHVAGGRRGEFNHRYAQPSVQPTPSFGHLFPHADDPQTDATGTTAGLLDTQRARGGMPKIFYTDTSAEYWRGDAGLTHIDLKTGADVSLPDNVRRYLFASTQHSSGMLPQLSESMYGPAGNGLNVIDYRPLIRAALSNLLAWVKETQEPPPGAYPRISDGTAVTRPALLERLEGIAGLALPTSAGLNRIRPLDLGPEPQAGIGRLPVNQIGEPYESIVSSVNEDGNEVAGVAMPDVSVPVGTHTGFNPRHPDSGGAGQLVEYVGSTRLFGADEIERRYDGREAYLVLVREAAEKLVEQRYLLAEDVELCVDLAGERYDYAMSV